MSDFKKKILQQREYEHVDDRRNLSVFRPTGGLHDDYTLNADYAAPKVNYNNPQKEYVIKRVNEYNEKVKEINKSYKK